MSGETQVAEKSLSLITKGAFAIALSAIAASVILAVQLNETRTELERVSTVLEVQQARLDTIAASQDNTSKRNNSNALRIADLNGRLDRIEYRSRYSSHEDTPGSDSKNSDDEPAGYGQTKSSPQINTGPLRYSRIHVPYEGIEVWQNDDGNIQAKNDDPAMTGKMLLVQVEDQSGNLHNITVVAPPPGK